VCNWFVEFAEADIIEPIGHVPPAIMKKVEEAIQRYRAGRGD
jgi:hypothetical protein